MALSVVSDVHTHSHQQCLVRVNKQRTSVETLNKDGRLIGICLYNCILLLLPMFLRPTSQRWLVGILWSVLKTVHSTARVALVEDQVMGEGGDVSGGQAEESAHQQKGD